MNLKEWKTKTFQDLKEEAKKFVSLDEMDNALNLVSKEVVEEIVEELTVENYREVVEDFEDLDLQVSIICEETGVEEFYEFIPEEFGEEIDIVLEMKAELLEDKIVNLSEIKNLFFAEDYDFEIDEKTGMADVTFTRSKGTITKKKKCKTGYKLKGNKCIPQTGTEKAGNRKVGIKLKRAKKAMGSGKKKKAALKAKITKKRVAGKARNFSNT